MNETEDVKIRLTALQSPLDCRPRAAARGVLRPTVPYLTTDRTLTAPVEGWPGVGSCYTVECCGYTCRHGSLPCVDSGANVR